MVCRDFKDITGFQAHNLMWETNLIGYGASYTEFFLHYVGICRVDVAKQELTGSDIPCLFLFQVVVHTEFGALVKSQDLPTIQIIVNKDDFGSPAFGNMEGSCLHFVYVSVYFIQSFTTA